MSDVGIDCDNFYTRFAVTVSLRLLLLMNVIVLYDKAGV